MLINVEFEALKAIASSAVRSDPKLELATLLVPRVATLEELGLTGIDEGWKAVDAAAEQVDKTFSALMQQHAPELHYFYELKAAIPDSSEALTSPARAKGIQVVKLDEVDRMGRDRVEAVLSYLGARYYEVGFQLTGSEEASPRQLKKPIRVLTSFDKANLESDNSKSYTQLASKKKQLGANFAHLQRFEVIIAALSDKIVGQGK